MIDLSTCRVAITGHTKGIGASFVNVLKEYNANPIGYSRSNGFDIGDQNIVKKILDDSANIDIFINNAYHPIGQFELLKGLIDRWQGTNKIIININSKLIYYPLGIKDGFFDEYILAKQAQNKLTKEIILSSNNCKIRLLDVILGVTDTNMAEIEMFYNYSKANPTDVARVVVNTIKYMDVLSINEIVINPT